MLKLLKSLWDKFVNAESETPSRGILAANMKYVTIREMMAEKAGDKLTIGSGTIMLLGPEEVAPIPVIKSEPKFKPRRKLAAIIVTAHRCECEVNCGRATYQIARFSSLMAFETAQRLIPADAKTRFVLVEREILRLLDPSLYPGEQLEQFDQLFASPQVKPSESN